MEKIKFTPGALVLVNYPGYGFWPCRVTRVLSKWWRKVEYFGGREIGKAHLKVIREYDDVAKNNLKKYIPKKNQIKCPMLRLAVEQINKMFVCDRKEQMGASAKKNINCKKGANNNKVLRLTSSESTVAANNNSGLLKDLASENRSSSTTKNADTPKLNAGAAFNETSGKKSESFKLVRSNVYRTCACLEMCGTDSCGCVGYLQECSESCKCGDSCSNMGLTVGEGKRVFLASSDVHGTGCFADEDIEKGDFVGEYVGQIVSKVEAARKRNQSKFLFTTGDKHFVIDASKFGSELTRINHKDEKSGENCEFKLKRVRGEWRVGVWALEDISKGVELFADYGKQYWE